MSIWKPNNKAQDKFLENYNIQVIEQMFLKVMENCWLIPWNSIIIIPAIEWIYAALLNTDFNRS